MKIPFNNPPYTGNEEKYVLESMQSAKISGDGQFTKRCQEWFERELNCKKTLLTPSCTHALEMMAILLDIKNGDEVIMPSYTFVSTANAFALRGAKIVFVDIRSDTMNIDETKIESAITEKTKAIVVVHYAGIACEMDTILDIAKRNDLYVLEDAAQAISSFYKGKPLGTLGHLGAFSFHETKNITSAGEGGLLIINDEKFITRAEIIREKGTNRSQFLSGMVDKYSWVDIGSSYLMSDVSASFLWGQIEKLDLIIKDRIKSWKLYYTYLQVLEENGLVALPKIQNHCEHNAHMFYLKVKNVTVRDKLLSYLLDNEIVAVFHYVPLHTSKAGRVFGVFHGVDAVATMDSQRLIRLPMYFNLSEKDIERISKVIKDFFHAQ